MREVPYKKCVYIIKNRKGEITMPEKPSEREEEYFARMEYERRKKVEEFI